MVKNAIKVFGRVKPIASNRNTGEYHIYHADDIDADTLMLSTFSSERQDTFRFRFEKVFDQCTNQEDIFNLVAKPVVESVLSGYNGTVFAYGQTGSGKTFTMSGGATSYDDRGIIPRSVQHLFGVINQEQVGFTTMCVSYLEIYNEHGYDLLDSKHEALKLQDLPQVSLLEDASGKLHIRNLSVHRVNSKEEALNLLFVGDSNRMTIHTPMNPQSSRSHCIFTIYLTSHNSLTTAVHHSKLNLVDLAGSERVYKSQLGGQMLVEARHINLSLHFLEQVIIALGESNRSHIPYRNSLLTTILRDSVGGNCMTVMVATLCLCITNIQESISTCRFAQRVALIKNDVNVSEHLDPQQEIAMLRAEVQQLRAQLAKHNTRQDMSELTSEDIVECRKLVNTFLHNEEAADLSQLHDEKKIRMCFHLLKNSVQETSPSREKCDKSQQKEQVQEYLQQLKQRDSCINNLLSVLKNKKEKRHCNRKEENVLPDSELSHFMDYAKFDEKTCEGFAQFMSKPGNRQQLDKYETLLKEKYEEAKRIATEIKQSQDNIKNLHNMLKKYAQHCTVISRNDMLVVETKNKIMAEQTFYKKKLEHLKNLKSETDYFKCELEEIKTNLLLKFKKNWETQNDLTTIKHKESFLKDNHCSKLSCSENISSYKSSGRSSDENCKVRDREDDDSNNFSTFKGTCPIDGIQNEIFLEEMKAKSSHDSTENYTTVRSNTDQNFGMKNRRNDLQNTYMVRKEGDEISAKDRKIADEIGAFNSLKNVNEDLTLTSTKSHDKVVLSEDKRELEESVPEDNNNDKRKEGLLMENIPLTGDAEIDEEIIAFYRARNQLVCR